MKKFIILSFVCILSGFMLVACQRNQGVQAGNESGQAGTYQPRPAPAPKGGSQQNAEMSGELRHIDMAAKTISIRVDSGMEQTFKFDDKTMVMGLEGQPQANPPSKADKTSNTSIWCLVGKEGSEVTLQWRDEGSVKMATHVNVTQAVASKNTRSGGKGKTKSTY